MENFDITSTQFVKYPPNSNLPKGLVNSKILKNNFLTKSASMMPKIEVGHAILNSLKEYF